MEFRRATEDNPETNCEFYNKMKIRALARELHTAVARFEAIHEGVPQAQGMAMAEDTFRGLCKELEVAEGARVILTHNLAVEQGLMNGTQGVIKEIVFGPGDHPNHDDPAHRMPQSIIIEFPQYVGPPFFDTTLHPEKKTWVPLLRRTQQSDSDRGISRTQFPLVLGWALTPWKAQGMTLQKAIVNLGEKAGSPGVAFVALSRVIHPDNLMLDDSFPSMSVIMKQRNHPSFQQRQHWERLMRARYSRTIRHNMRDDVYYFSPDRVWSSDDSCLADELLQFLRSHRDTDDDAIPDAFLRDKKTSPSNAVQRVWARLHQSPHIFELAFARGNLDTYTLRGDTIKDEPEQRKASQFS